MPKDKQSPEKLASSKTPKKTSAKKAAAKAAAPVSAPVPAVPPAAPSATQSVAKSAVQAAPSGKPSHEQLFREISIRAYELYCSRGAQHGAHQDDWLRAEAEIRAKYKI